MELRGKTAPRIQAALTILLALKARYNNGPDPVMRLQRVHMDSVSDPLALPKAKLSEPFGFACVAPNLAHLAQSDLVGQVQHKPQWG